MFLTMADKYKRLFVKTRRAILPFNLFYKAVFSGDAEIEKKKPEKTEVISINA